ncbi:MAG: tetratricopeptide repeat protein [Alphaproteobacteria bacterium]|nr:MAG: tetratricopeptide repeat protein [Alphaproteobacteria bacterium]
MVKTLMRFVICLLFLILPLTAVAADNPAIKRVDAILPVNLKQYQIALEEEKKFDMMVKASIRKASKDPLLYQAYAAKGSMRSNPNDLRANEVLCDAYKRTGYHAAAAKQCREVLKINPKSSLAKTAIADIAFRQGKGDAAKGLLEEVLSDDPHYSQANLVLAEIAKSRGENTEAYTQVGQALQSNPDAPTLLAMGDLQMKSGQTDQATNTYLKVLQIDSKNTVALSNLANLFGGKGDYQRALDFAQQAAASDANSALAQYTLGTQYQNNGKFEEAIVSYARATQLDPNFALAHRSLGEALIRKGSPVDAITSLNRAIQLAPNDPAAKADLQRAYAMTGQAAPVSVASVPVAAKSPAQNRIQDQDFTKGAPQTSTTAPNNVMKPPLAAIKNTKLIDDYTKKAKMAEAGGQYEVARQYYEQLAIQDPGEPDYFYNIGRIYTVAQQWGLAKQFYNLALELNPNHAMSLNGLARVQCFDGNSAAAWQNYSKANSLGLVDNNSETRNYLTKTCPTTNKTSDAH